MPIRITRPSKSTSPVIRPRSGVYVGRVIQFGPPTPWQSATARRVRATPALVVKTMPEKTKVLVRIRKDLRLVGSRLRRIVTREEMNRWINAQNAALDGQTPLQTIVHGDTDRVLQLITQVEKGIYV